MVRHSCKNRLISCLQNDAIPEEDEEDQVIEIAHSESRDGTPHKLENGSLDNREGPDAYSTPPPPQMEDDEENKGNRQNRLMSCLIVPPPLHQKHFQYSTLMYI